jgi:hypothetical protein
VYNFHLQWNPEVMDLIVYCTVFAGQENPPLYAMVLRESGINDNALIIITVWQQISHHRHVSRFATKRGSKHRGRYSVSNVISNDHLDSPTLPAVEASSANETRRTGSGAGGWMNPLEGGDVCVRIVLPRQRVEWCGRSSRFPVSRGDHSVKKSCNLCG